jgi:hypothetical protein
LACEEPLPDLCELLWGSLTLGMLFFIRLSGYRVLNLLALIRGLMVLLSVWLYIGIVISDALVAGRARSATP